MKVIFVQETEEMVEICYYLTTKGADFKASEYESGWKIEITGY
jgi:hypothetical protein